MRNNLVVAAAIAAAVLLPSAAFAGDKTVKHAVSYNYAVSESSYGRTENYTLVRPGDLSKGASAFIKAHANTHEAQSLIKNDRALAAELRAHGVQVRNVIGAEKAINGRLVIYIK
jgi:rRNA-processing protein FCF1